MVPKLAFPLKTRTVMVADSVQNAIYSLWHLEAAAQNDNDWPSRPPGAASPRVVGPLGPPLRSSRCPHPPPSGTPLPSLARWRSSPPHLPRVRTLPFNGYPALGGDLSKSVRFVREGRPRRYSPLNRPEIAQNTTFPAHSARARAIYWAILPILFPIRSFWRKGCLFRDPISNTPVRQLSARGG